MIQPYASYDTERRAAQAAILETRKRWIRGGWDTVRLDIGENDVDWIVSQLEAFRKTQEPAWRCELEE